METIIFLIVAGIKAEAMICPDLRCQNWRLGFRSGLEAQAAAQSPSSRAISLWRPWHLAMSPVKSGCHKIVLVI